MYNTSPHVEEETPVDRSFSSNHPGLLQLSRNDWIFIGCGVCLTFAITLCFGTGRTLWEDEVLGWMLLKDPSWRHMIFSWNHGADGGGFAFYLTGRFWFGVLGASTLSFRLCTSTCFAAAFVLLWLAARRYYAPLTLALSFGVTWFLSPVLVPHMAEGRFYGLFLAATSAFILVILKASEAGRPTGTLLVLAFLASSLLVTSHILGIAYSCCLLCAWVLIDHLRRVRNTSLYLAAMASWLWLIPSRHAIFASAAVGKPHFWTMQPNLLSFLLAYTGESLRTSVLLIALTGLLLVQLRSRAARRAAVASAVQRRPILLLACGLLMIPPAFYLEGLVGPIIFNERYLQPVEIGLAFVFAEILTHLRWPSFRSASAGRWLPVAASALLFAMVIEYDLNYLPKYAKQHTNYAAELTRNLPAQVPVVCEDGFSFTELMHTESESRVNYQYLLDWQHSIDATAPRLEVTEFHLMENWKKVGYFARHIEYRDAFLARHPYFLVLHTNQRQAGTLFRQADNSARKRAIGNPLAARFASEPGYSELPYGQQTLGNLQEVETLVCNQAVDCPAVLRHLKTQDERTSLGNTSLHVPEQ